MCIRDSLTIALFTLSLCFDVCSFMADLLSVSSPVVTREERLGNELFRSRRRVFYVAREVDAREDVRTRSPRELRARSAARHRHLALAQGRRYLVIRGRSRATRLR